MVTLLRNLGVAALLAICCCAAPQAVAAESPANLGLVAQPSSSHVSGDTRNLAINDGYDPASSDDSEHGSYGNWPRTGMQWVEYEWPQPISTDKVDVYWWSDHRGIHPPKACRLLYWNGDAYQPVSNAEGLGVAIDAYNTTTFDEVTTTRLRLEIDSDGTNSTGILEWKVFGNGELPVFAPTVVGDVDRIVMLGGKTYLHGGVKTLADESQISVAWSKASGPGKVSFADPSSLETTAEFSKTGEYELELTVGQEGLTDSARVHVSVENPPPNKPLGVVYTKRYSIDSPLWNHRAKALITEWIPYCVEKINDPNLPEGGLNNFSEAAKKLAGQPAKPHRGYIFANAWVHQTVESICIALMVDPQGDEDIIEAQESLRATLEDWIPQILAAQEPDGYMQTAFTLDDESKRWSPEYRTGHEGYTAGYFIESAINHYTLTEGTDLRLYDAAKKLADCWVRHIGPEPGKQAWYDEHQEMEQALVRFGRFVNDMEGAGAGDDYIQLAKFLLDCRGGGAEYDQSHVPVQQQYEAVGHAVRAVYSYSGMADVAAETGDLDYRSAVMSLWDNLINKKYYVTGGIGSGETSEGFGPNYSLPNRSYCESCSSCGQVFFQYKMNLSYHDAKYSDLYEETFYNALLGSLDLPGKNFYYQNPLNSGTARYPWHGCPCCIGNIPRTLLMLPTWTYVTDDDSVYVNLYIGGTTRIDGVAGTSVEMIQKTNYPWDGDVAITVNPSNEAEFAVRVRSPQRSVSELYTSLPEADGIGSIQVNGEPVEAPPVNGYRVIQRTWKPGDTIAMTLPMKVQRVKCVDEVAANRGRVALRYGPLVYNVESVDGNSDDGVLAPDAKLTTQWVPGLLGGVVIIKGEFTDGKPLLAIPNFARNNRIKEGSNSRSRVWVRDE